MSRNQRQFNQSLHFRLIVIILLAVGLFTSIFIFYGIKQTRSALLGQTAAFGETLANGIAASCIYILHTGDDIGLRQTIESIGRAYDKVHTIEVFVAKTLVAKYSALDPGVDINPADKISEKGIAASAPIIIKIKGETLELGVVNVSFSEDAYLEFYMDFYIAQMKSSIIAGLVLLVIISAFLFLVLDYIIVSPILVVESGTKIIAEGNLDHRINIRNRDEIGKLAFAFNEMTERVKASKEEIELWNENLERKVGERTEMLKKANTDLKQTQYQLVQSGKMAAIGLLGAGIAHELNNPLVGIIGYIQLMLMKMKKGHFAEEDFAAFQKNLHYVEKESQRCKRIVDDLLNYARESKKFFEPVDIKRTIDQTVSIMEYQVRKWHIKITKDFPDEQIVVMGNSDKLQQVYINLIANAHHAMPEGGDIDIALQTVVENGVKLVQVLFTDTGCGIAKDDLDKVFESFFSNNRDMNNLGLGLSISSQIIQDHKGKIAIESEEGKGTTFIITVPVLVR